MSDIFTVYINQDEFFLMPFFESFLTCNVLEIAWVANVNNFSVTLRYFILIATYVTKCLLTFLRATQKYFSYFNYWKKCGESVSLLVHILMYLLLKTTSFFLPHVFATVKSNLFLCLFFLAYIPIIEYYSHLFVNFTLKHVNRDSRLIYEINLFNKAHSQV